MKLRKMEMKVLNFMSHKRFANDDFFPSTIKALVEKGLVKHQFVITDAGRAALEQNGEK